MSEQQAHTPGPWRWAKREYVGSKTVELVHPHNGHLLVMDFVRLGMQGGTFRLATWKGDERANMGGIMRPAHEIDLTSHPDANLIAAAPAMDLALALLIAGLAKIDRFGDLVEFCFDGMRYSHNGDWTALMNVIGWDKARGAVAKAKGTVPA